MAEQLADELYGVDRGAHWARRLPILRKKFRVGLLRGEDDPLVSAVLSAGSTDQRVAMLRRAARQMGDRAFQAWLQTAITERVVSRDVLGRLQMTRERQRRNSREPLEAAP